MSAASAAVATTIGSVATAIYRKLFLNSNESHLRFLYTNLIYISLPLT